LVSESETGINPLWQSCEPLAKMVGWKAGEGGPRTGLAKNDRTHDSYSRILKISNKNNSTYQISPRKKKINQAQRPNREYAPTV